jgi:hypothetical protein
LKKVTYKFARIRNKLPFFAEVELAVESGFEKIEVRFDCSGSGWKAQGHLEEAPQVGYDDWKSGAKKGIEYAAKQASIPNCLVIVTAIRGLTTDTNPVIIAGASAFAFWEAIGFQPGNDLKETIEAKVFSNWANQSEFFE